MFGNKKTQSSETDSSVSAAPVREVPVYTVHSLPRAYEVLCTVYSGKVSSASPVNILRQLARAGGAVPECDAVIGILATPAVGVGVLHAYGTAIRYL